MIGRARKRSAFNELVVLEVPEPQSYENMGHLHVCNGQITIAVKIRDAGNHIS